MSEPVQVLICMCLVPGSPLSTLLELSVSGHGESNRIPYFSSEIAGRSKDLLNFILQENALASLRSGFQTCGLCLVRSSNILKVILE